jgi:hypothetical protein
MLNEAARKRIGPNEDVHVLTGDRPGQVAVDHGPRGRYVGDLDVGGSEPRINNIHYTAEHEYNNAKPLKRNNTYALGGVMQGSKKVKNEINSAQ